MAPVSSQAMVVLHVARQHSRRCTRRPAKQGMHHHCSTPQPHVTCKMLLDGTHACPRPPPSVSCAHTLNPRFYSRLDSRYEPLVRSVETSLLRHALVTALRAGRKDRVAEFFREFGSALLGGPEAGEWRAWFALAYLEAPEKDPAFQVGRLLWVTVRLPISVDSH